MRTCRRRAVGQSLVHPLVQAITSIHIQTQVATPPITHFLLAEFKLPSCCNSPSLLTGNTT